MTRVAHFLGDRHHRHLEDEYFISAGRPSRRRSTTEKRRSPRKRDILNYEYFIDGNHPRAIPRRRWNSLFPRIFHVVPYPFSSSLSFLFSLFYFIASLKVERAKWLCHFTIIGAAEREKETEKKKKIEMYKREAEY